MTIIEALVRTCVVIGIGWLIALLSFRLRERQELFQGLFYNSEAGSILVKDSEQGRIIEEFNYKASELLHRKPSELRGAPLTLFWQADSAEDLISDLSTKRAVHAKEAVFSLTDGNFETVLVSAATLPEKRVIITFVEITRRVYAENALKAANDKLNLLSRISKDHLQSTVDQIVATVQQAETNSNDPVAGVFLTG